LKNRPHCLFWFSFKESVSKSQNALGVWTTKVLTVRNCDSSEDLVVALEYMMQ